MVKITQSSVESYVNLWIIFEVQCVFSSHSQFHTFQNFLFLGCLVPFAFSDIFPGDVISSKKGPECSEENKFSGPLDLIN